MKKSPNYDIIKEDAGGKWQLTADIERSVVVVSNHECATIINNGLLIKPHSTMQSWMHLMLELGQMKIAGDIKDILFKFYTGDALNQGEDIFGESYAVVLGDVLPFDMSYIDNIRWVCRKVPPENRRLQLKNWRYHQILAPLSREEQAHFNEIAVPLFESGNKSWCKEMEAAINDFKIKEILMGIEDKEEQQRWNRLARCHKPKWVMFKKWITGDAEAPAETMVMADWIKIRIKDMDVDPDERDKVVTAMFDLAEGLKRHEIVRESKDIGL